LNIVEPEVTLAMVENGASVIIPAEVATHVVDKMEMVSTKLYELGISYAPRLALVIVTLNCGFVGWRRRGKFIAGLND
jgi:hypothetical protein